MNIFLSPCTMTMTPEAQAMANTVAQSEFVLNEAYVCENKDVTVNAGHVIEGEYIAFQTSYCHSRKEAVTVVKNNNR